MGVHICYQGPTANTGQYVVNSALCILLQDMFAYYPVFLSIHWYAGHIYSSILSDGSGSCSLSRSAMVYHTLPFHCHFFHTRSVPRQYDTRRLHVFAVHDVTIARDHGLIRGLAHCRLKAPPNVQYVEALSIETSGPTARTYRDQGTTLEDTPVRWIGWFRNTSFVLYMSFIS